jgi:hypothetical protein
VRDRARHGRLRVILHVIAEIRTSAPSCAAGARRRPWTRRR